MAGISGFTLRVGLSELGPLSALVSVDIPGGIVIHPPTGLAISFNVSTTAAKVMNADGGAGLIGGSSTDEIIGLLTAQLRDALANATRVNNALGVDIAITADSVAVVSTSTSPTPSPSGPCCWTLRR